MKIQQIVKALSFLATLLETLLTYIHENGEAHNNQKAINNGREKDEATRH